jgi:hypothetical protein
MSAGAGIAVLVIATGASGFNIVIHMQVAYPNHVTDV